jgi:phenylacetate-CoA ligase
LRAWAQTYGASLHLWERSGYRYGEKVVQLGAPPSLHPESRALKARIRRGLERRVVSTAGFEIDHSTSLQRALKAGEAGGAVWYGYASTVAAMASAVAGAGRRVRGPRAIITTSEPLRPEWRRRIEDVFKAPVFDEYGCNDGGVFALSCLRGRFHLAENLSIVEVLEGNRPCPPGIEGDVVVTNLHARVLPFLRYKVGDRAALGEGPCPCGCPGATLERLAGREGDRLLLSDGKELSLPALTHCFWETRNVRQWQIVQRGPRRIVVRLDAAPAFGETEAELIVRALRLQCGGGVDVSVTTSEPIERTPAGKHRIVIRSFT